MKMSSSGSTSGSPVKKRNLADPGDETSRRYRYQFGYGVILLVASHRSELDYKAIWCEQYEDFLCEISENFFDAFQIKTRKPELGEWKLTDKEFAKSITRFAMLKGKYPSCFRRFKFVSNAKFSNSDAKSKSHLSPIKLLNSVKDVPEWKKLEGLAKKGFESLRKKIKVDAEKLFNVLKQLDLANGPPLDSFEDVLSQTHIAKLDECSHFNATLLGRTLEALIQKVYQASSLVTDDPAVHYVALNDERRKDPLLRAKRISLEDLTLTVREVHGKLFSYLPSLASLQLGAATNKLDTLQTKMMRGGLAQHYEMMRRRTLSAEQALLDLTTRPNDGPEICSQLENIVFGECDDALLRESQNPEPFGGKMLIKVQDRLTEIVENEPARVHHQDVNLLVGIAGLLTTECTVWWSDRFQLKET